MARFYWYFNFESSLPSSIEKKLKKRTLKKNQNLTHLRKAKGIYTIPILEMNSCLHVCGAGRTSADMC